MIRTYELTWLCDGEVEIYECFSDYNARTYELENMGYESGIDFI